ncbi:DUF4192 domain-containing protein [Nocardia sp. NPDC055053]
MEADHEQSESPSFAQPSGADAFAAVRVNDAGQLIAAVPAMLRFVPTQSLVLALLTPTPGTTAPRRAIQMVVRLDLDAVTDLDNAGEVMNLLETMCQRENATATTAIAVDDRPDAEATARLAVELLRSSTVGLVHAWLVPIITAGATYRGLLDGDTAGTVNDPAASPVAFAQILDGVQIRSSRIELLDLIAVDTDAAAALAPLIDPAVEHYRTELAAAVAQDRRTTFQHDAARAVLDQIAVIGEFGCAFECLATVVAALRDVVIRDVMLGLTSTQATVRSFSAPRSTATTSTSIT